MNFKKFIIISFAIASFNAFAEKWISVGEGLYIDTNSRKRDGDLAKINVKYGNDTRITTVDCKNFKFVYPLWTEEKIQEGSTFAEIITLACTKWYEVWK